MDYRKIVCLNLLLISSVLICFEIISTRISSVIFVTNYAFIILSLAILGLGTGGVFSYYKINPANTPATIRVIAQFVFFIGIFLCLFIICVIRFPITNPFIYFPFLFLPFFFAGIVYALLFKTFAGESFKIYAADLTGAALGAVGSIVAFSILNAPNAVLFLALILFLAALNFIRTLINKNLSITLYSLLFLNLLLLGGFGHRTILGDVPIGNFAEKDFYYVYPNLNRYDYEIVDSRWSLYGRSDLVEYYHQDLVKQLFIDGAAGSPMYRFNGNPQAPGAMLSNILIQQSTAVPFMFLREHEKNQMLVIGPGGGKEVLIGLLTGVRYITGVEVNPDFVDIVKNQRAFNGGIYTDFPNIRILVKEGRHFIKSTEQKFDLIVLALPSTEQLQNIDHMATSENYLLTVEALRDYLGLLTPEGTLIFSVHNRWELIRLIVTTLYAFDASGISHQEALNHFVLLADNYTPTIMIKKEPFSSDDIAHINSIVKQMPAGLPAVTYQPYHWDKIRNTMENRLLQSIRKGQISLRQYIKNDNYDISPVYDDSPYFYKVNRGIQRDYLWLCLSVAAVGCLVIAMPFIKIKRSLNRESIQPVVIPLKIFVSIGIGFMILEITLFQKLILYLGSPTISLAILLASLLIGMGSGSYLGKTYRPEDPQKRLNGVSLAIIILGAAAFLFYPFLLNLLLVYSQVFRSIVCFLLLLPFGFLLGIPFPSAIEILKNGHLDNYVPWMYGVNGIMSVFGSVMAVILSMMYGFTMAFYFGLSFYLIVFFITLKPNHVQERSKRSHSK